MEKREKIFVEELKGLKQDEVVTSDFLVTGKNRLLTKAGKPYLALKLSDSSGEVEARVWNRADESSKLFEQADFVRVRARVDYYMDNLQLKVMEVLRLAPEEVDPALFAPSPAADEESLWKSLLGFMEMVSDAALKKLLVGFFGDESFAAAFRKAPAAKRMHHDYPGGLLEHTVGVARVVASVCDIYKDLDREILIAGALLHDIGKVRELLSFPQKDYSHEGRLIGHVVLGVEMLDEKLGQIEGLEEERAMLLKHLLISHHGLQEFGSPVPPMTLEGFVLNFADDLDAKLSAVKKSLAKVEGEGPGFSPYHRLLERHLYRARGYIPGEEEGDESQGD